jgi:hypothetical protein
MRRLLLISAIVAATAIAACSPDGSPASPDASGLPDASFEPSSLPSDDLSSEMPSVEVSPEASVTP